MSQPTGKVAAWSDKFEVDCEACRGRIDGLCSVCTPATLAAISRYKTAELRLEPGQHLFRLSEPCEAIYNLVDGWVLLYTLLDDGRRQILHFALPGSVLGFHPAQGAMATYAAQALTAATVCMIPHDSLLRLSRKNPDIALRLAWLVSRDRSLAYDHLTSVGRHSARRRVAHLLLELFIRYRSQWPGHHSDQMHLPLTQEHIGEATGLTGVHVNRVLASLRDDGIITFHYRQLRILDPDRLFDVAGLDPQVVYSWTRREPSR